MENIRDFIILHYLTDRDDTEFWRDMKKIDLPNSLNEKLEKWKSRLPIKEDFSETEYFLFFEQNWTNVLYGLKFFNIDDIRSEYESYDTKIKDSIESLILTETDYKTMTHKQYLESIRQLKFN
jgi:tryptophan halogenase